MSVMSGLEKLKSINPLVIGDIMLDRFIYGKVERISPEAPVPIFRYDHEKEMLGGAGNVVANITSIGSKCDFLGVIGNDPEGRKISNLLKEIGVHSHLLKLNDYPTILKSRMIAGNNHLLRVDHEKRLPVMTEVLDRFSSILLKAIKGADVVLLSDYNKGIFTAETTRMIIDICRQLNKPVIVDPKGMDYSKYTGATLIKPNLKEFGEATGRKYNPAGSTFHDEVKAGAVQLMEKYDIANLIVTLSEYGMLHISRKDQVITHIFTEAREVYDVSGAGDTTLATLGLAIGSGMKIKDAMRLANKASGIVVGKLGTATVTFEELCNAWSGDHSKNGSVTNEQNLQDIIARAAGNHQSVTIVSGSFAGLTAEMIEKLSELKQGCDKLLAVITGSAEHSLAKAVLASHVAVDYVVEIKDWDSFKAGSSFAASVKDVNIVDLDLQA